MNDIAEATISTEGDKKDSITMVRVGAASEKYVCRDWYGLGCSTIQPEKQNWDSRQILVM